VKGRLGGLKQVLGMEAGRKPLQPHRRHVPVAIAAGAPEQIELAGRTFEESGPQFAAQDGISARRSGKGRIKGTVVERHAAIDSANWVNAGFIPNCAVV
jgi:hypothetical protein